MGAIDTVRLARRLGFLEPARLVAATGAAARWGPTIATLYGAAALRFPTRPAVVDHRGTLSFGELDRRSRPIEYCC